MRSRWPGPPDAQRPRHEGGAATQVQVVELLGQQSISPSSVPGVDGQGGSMMRSHAMPTGTTVTSTVTEATARQTHRHRDGGRGPGQAKACIGSVIAGRAVGRASLSS